MSSGCGDVLSLADLQTAKKHQIFEAEVITGRVGGVASGASIDYASNPVTGQVQKTMPAILRDIGFAPASFDFTTGGTLTTADRDKAVLWPLASGGDGDWYYWEGALPKVIPASSTPASTGGVAVGAWKPVGDLTLRQELSAPTGIGLVGGAWIIPEMFYSGSGSHSAAVQAAFDRSETTGELVYLTGTYYFDVPVTVSNNVNVMSGQKAAVMPYPGSGNGTAFIFGPNNYNRRFELPAISGFTQPGVGAVIIRCDLAQIWVRQFVGCDTCFQTITDSDNNSILDLTMEFNTISGCEVAWHAHLESSSNILQGAMFKGNFVTDTTRVFKRTGISAFDDGIMIDLNAVDITNRAAGGVFLDNQVSGHTISRMIVNVRSWFGGEGFSMSSSGAAKIVSGQFNSGEMRLTTVRSFTFDNLPANQWRAGVLQTTNTAASLGQVRVLPLTPDLSLFNGGVPLSNTEFIVRIILESDLPAGSEVVGYFWNVFADGSYPRWRAVPIEGNTRLMLSRITDQSSTEIGRVLIGIRNTSPNSVVAGQSVYFRVSRD